MNEDREALAAEYVLGTLDADERAQVELDARTDRNSRPGPCLGKDSSANCTIWSSRSSRRRISGAHHGPADGASAPSGGAEVIDLTKRLRRWRNATYVVSGALAASLLLFVAVKETAPQLLPTPLRPADVSLRYCRNAMARRAF